MKKIIVGVLLLTLIVGAGILSYGYVDLNRINEDLKGGKGLDLEYLEENMDRIMFYSGLPVEVYSLVDYYESLGEEEQMSLEVLIPYGVAYERMYGKMPHVFSEGEEIELNEYVQDEILLHFRRFNEEVFGHVEALYSSSVPSTTFQGVKEKLKSDVDKEILRVTQIMSEGKYNSISSLSNVEKVFSDYDFLKEVLNKGNGQLGTMPEEHTFLLASYKATYKNLSKDSDGISMLLFTEKLITYLDEYSEEDTIEWIKEIFLETNDANTQRDNMMLLGMLTLEANLQGKSNYRVMLRKLREELYEFENREYSLIDNVFVNESENYTYIIDPDDLNPGEADEIAHDPYRTSFLESIRRGEWVDEKVLEPNKTYYLVWTNDYLCFESIEIINTFDGDYSQFAHGMDTEEVLEDKMKLVMSQTNLSKGDYNYLESLDTDFEENYRQMVLSVMEKYDKILEPLIISDDISHYFNKRGGRYYVNVADLQYERVKTTDVNFYLIDSFNEGYAAEATWGGMVISKQVIENKYYFMIHHELMHLIDEFYDVNFDIALELDMPDKDYLNETCSTYDEYLEIKKQGNEIGLYYSGAVKDYLDYGVTSSYSMVNESEHQAELWANLVSNNDYFAPDYDSNPVFKVAADDMFRYINGILFKVEAERLENFEDFKRFQSDYE